MPSIIGWILLGIVAAVVANQLSGKRGVGLVPDAIVGIAGAAVAGFAFNMFVGREEGGMGLGGLFVSLVGAGGLLAASRSIVGRRVPAPSRIRPKKPIRR